MKRFGLMGLSFVDANKGCEALTYTFLKMLQDIYKDEQIELVCIANSEDLGKIPEFFPKLSIYCHVLNKYSVLSWISTYNVIKSLDAVFDASYGDGFTGIYGTARNFIQIMRKQIVYWAGKPVFLLPQTYGRYKFPFKRWSERMIDKAALAYARDDTGKMLKRASVKKTSDMAFGLPFDKTLYPMTGERKRIGINVSSLLWDASTVGRFGLTLDYRKFYVELLNYLTSNDRYEVHIIPHVIDVKNYKSGENDCRVLDEIKGIYGDKVVQAPAFDNCIAAKSYIANMDVFLGSRMHATIGAISSGVATIPFSYCHKFEALYGNLNYPYVISATKVSTEEALQVAKEWVATPEKLKESGSKAVVAAKQKLMEFEGDLRDSLSTNGLL